MDRRSFLGGSLLTGIAAPVVKEPQEIKAHGNALFLEALMRLFSLNVRCEMPTAQWHVWQVYTSMPEMATYRLLPVSINNDLPNTEIRLVAFDGTVMGRITGLALPLGFK